MNAPSLTVPAAPDTTAPAAYLAAPTRSAHVDTFARDLLPAATACPTVRFDLPELRYPDRVNCAVELLDGTIMRVGGHRPCVRTDDGEVWSYNEVADLVNRVAAVLVEDLHVVPGNRVLLRGPNTRWLLVCWLAALRAGAVVVTTMPLLRARELRECLDKAAVDVALCDDRYLDELRDAGLAANRIVSWGAAADADLTRRAESKAAGFVPVDTAADDIALIAFTSGTSGTPKATAHFHRDVLAIADTFSAHLLQPRADDVFAGSPPLAFTFGLGGLLVFPMRVGACTVMSERPAPKDLFASVARHGVTILFTAPTAYRAILEHLGHLELGSLRTCVSAGEALPAVVWHAFHDATGLRIVDGIGSTEMLHVFVSAAGDDIRPGSTGRAVPGFRARVVDDSGRPVPTGVVGMLAVQGPTGCRYLDDERQQRYVRDGWNLTGDRYLQDSDGYLWHQGRADDLIVSSGYNIAGPEVEHTLVRHPDVVESGVVGVPDEARGTVVKAFVVLAAGVVADDAKARELQEFVKSEIAPYKYPRLVEFVGSLPRTDNGKLRRALLRERS
ncbi:AMP-binding protein [Jatrophihabitans lederbergiae]|uniref:AMP-binding protein n=1 Tax=Jatrophihabitans lederbergiae TaxID=3075547 RepID=A0ABU2J7B7_9ACTN|nr:AMP-binding protein [Jatrophihabitans sp. DSM 44399]MDT0260876.1 AMP-binding protein [Jatrophihabitans sp. DSM 44399]